MKIGSFLIFNAVVMTSTIYGNSSSAWLTVSVIVGVAVGAGVSVNAGVLVGVALGAGLAVRVGGTGVLLGVLVNRTAAEDVGRVKRLLTALRILFPMAFICWGKIKYMETRSATARAAQTHLFRKYLL